MENTAKEIEEQLPTFEKIAEDIQTIANAMRKIQSSRVSRKLIVTLIHAQSKINKTNIEYVLNNLLRMDEIWLKRLPVQEPKK